MLQFEGCQEKEPFLTQGKISPLCPIQTLGGAIYFGLFTLLVNQADIFSLFVYMLKSPRLTLFTFQLNQAGFYPLSPSDHQRSKPVSQETRH
jgi:hypothetical protein